MQVEKNEGVRNEELAEDFGVWPQVIDSAFDQTTEIILQAAENEERGPRAKLDERFSRDTEELSNESVEALREGGDIIQEFWQTFDSYHVVAPSTGSTERYSLQPYFDPDIKRINKKELPFQITQTTAVIDPEGPRLPTTPEEARSQVQVTISDISEETEQGLVARYQGLLDGEEIVAEKMSAEKAETVTGILRSAQADVADTESTRITFETRKTYYDKKSEHVVFKPLAGVSISILLDGRIIVEATNHTLGEKFTKRLKSIDLPSQLDRQSVGDLNRLLNRTYGVINEEIPNFKR